jgi:NADPH-dependent 7-cyano-7-deazaguanine reductase QueF
MNESNKRDVYRVQLDELTGYRVYLNLANQTSDPANKKVLESIAAQELGHYNKWKSRSGVDIKPDWARCGTTPGLASFLG